MLRERILVLVTVAVAMLGATRAGADCVALDGKRLHIRSQSDDARDRISWKAKDPAGRLLLLDPTAGTTTIELVDRNGVVLTARTSADNAVGWKSSPGRPPIRSWSYSGNRDPAAPMGITRIKTTATMVDFTGKGADLDEIRAPLVEPLVMRLTTPTGGCFEATYKGCSRNDSGQVTCMDTCPSQALPPPAGADRTIVLDPAQCTPFEDRLRGFNVDIQNISGVNFETRGLDLLDRMFDPRPGRQIRLGYAPSHWPPGGFDASCQWLGGAEPRLDSLATRFAGSGAEVQLQMRGQPAMFSPGCVGVCDNRMVPGGNCTCGPDYAKVPPLAYDAAWREHWKCALKHYAALGVRRFEIWNEPDNAEFFIGTEAEFLALFEAMRLALEEARDELDPAVRDAIEIGGPANSQVEGAIAGAPGPLLPTLYASVAGGSGDANLEFASVHMYTGDPGLPFAAGWVDTLRSYVPSAWGARLDINEWNVSLGHNHPCDDDDPATPGIQAPAAGASPQSSEGCDHRGAGYAAYMLPGFLNAGTDVQPYVFDVFANGYSERCDMMETSLGLFTKHGLPKPTAAVHWAASQLRGRLLGAAQETLTEKSIGWIAAHDEAGTIHLLIGQFDVSQRDLFRRSYQSHGHGGTTLAADCNCATQQCLDGRFSTALADPDPVARLMSLCPGLNQTEATDAIAAAQLALSRQEGTTTTVALDVRSLSCRDTFTVEVFTVGQGSSTTDVWRAEPGPHQGATICDAGLAATIDAHPYDWSGIQDRLWDTIRTPTTTHTVAAGQSIPVLTVPAYGSVYVRIR